MTQKHTPGPWDIERPCGFPYTGIYVVSHKANHDKQFHSFIAEVRQYRESHEAEANARLIAQAPALLAERDRLREINREQLKALKLLYKAWEALIPCLGNSVVQDYGLVLTTAPCAAKTAIAKAEKE